MKRAVVSDLLGQQVATRALQAGAHLRVVRPLPRDRSSAAQHGAEHTEAREIRARRGDCCITVRHAGPLEGEVVVPGAKNSVLKLMAASLMADGVFEITNVPAIVDVGIMAELLTAIGLTITKPAADTLAICNTGELDAGRARTSSSSASGHRSTCSARC